MTTFKIMLLGEIGVGKSSLVRRLVHDEFDYDYKPTLGVDIYRYEAPPQAPGETPTTLLIWDTDGNFSETIFRHVYMRQAHAALIISDATRPATLETMATLSHGFRDAFPGRHHSLIINKLDLIKEEEKPQLPSSLADNPPPFMHTSAKNGHNVKTAFHDAATSIRRRED